MITISKSEYYAIIRAGLTPTNHDLGGFAEACYCQNTASELLEALTLRAADETDCENWGITPGQWRYAIREALESKAFDFEFDNDFSDIE